jgi:hypothetical protein
MAKREIRAVTAGDDIAGLIDRGSDIDTQVKNLTFEDKGIKTKITQSAQDQLDSGELSVRLVGKTAAAVVSGVEKVDLDVGSEQFLQVREATVNGILKGIVSRKLDLAVPEGDIERAAEELRKLVIQAVVTETFKVEDASDITDPQKAFVGSVQKTEAIVALSKCIKRDVSFRVKYEKI